MFKYVIVNIFLYLFNKNALLLINMISVSFLNVTLLHDHSSVFYITFTYPSYSCIIFCCNFLLNYIFLLIFATIYFKRLISSMLDFYACFELPALSNSCVKVIQSGYCYGLSFNHLRYIFLYNARFFLIIFQLCLLRILIFAFTCTC